MTVPSMQLLLEEANRTLGAIPPDLLTSPMRIGIYGAGFLGSWGIRWLRRNGIEPVACFDASPDRVGSRFLDVSIHSPLELGDLDLDFVFITARHAVPEVAAILQKHNATGTSLDAYYVAKHFSDFENVHDNILSDDRSRATLRSVMKAMLSGRPHTLQNVYTPEQYFCLPPFRGAEREVYIDAGAYVGDTIERFLWASAGSFAKIHAFEPGTRQFASLMTRCARLTAEWAIDENALHLNQAGLSDRSGLASSLSSSSDLQSLALSDGLGEVSTLALDDYLEGGSATFIKADVEGMEMRLLEGAKSTIMRCTPKLAICVYHFPSDIPEIVELIRRLVPSYNFALRHHSPRLMETVLYCWKD